LPFFIAQNDFPNQIHSEKDKVGTKKVNRGNPQSFGQNFFFPKNYNLPQTWNKLSVSG
jgi:hypothetical protein